MDSINALNVFVQAADTRSFVAAGRTLGISASAVGKSIVRLEERVGTRLFHRSTRSIALTADGTRFLERARRILAEIDEAEAEFSRIAVEPRGRLRVSLPLVGEPFLSTIAGFRRAYPDVELDLEFSDRRVDVIEEGFDAVVRSGDPRDSRLGSRLLGAFRMLLVASPEYLESRGVPLHASELVTHSCIQFRYPNTGKLQTWPLDVGAEFELPQSVVCNNLEARIRFAVEGVGIAFLPDYAIEEWLADGRLMAVLAGFVETHGHFRIMWPSAKYVTPKLRTFIDFMAEGLFPDHSRR
ncbi:LysR family transcriptional regulator [Paraburkholderia bengalensis]|uniref:LysR family transcriptional regulator n=1 Tax=Paraburkholderia bengalensis TaxID=2747562 RepID=A0ABU8J4Q9_9BURK